MVYVTTHLCPRCQKRRTRFAACGACLQRARLKEDLAILDDRRRHHKQPLPPPADIEERILRLSFRFWLKVPLFPRRKSP